MTFSELAKKETENTAEIPDRNPDTGGSDSGKVSSQVQKSIEKIDEYLDREKSSEGAEDSDKTAFEKNCGEFQTTEKDISRIKERSGVENSDGTFTDKTSGKTYSSFEDWYNQKCSEYKKESSRARTYKIIGDKETALSKNADGADKCSHNEKAEKAYNKAAEAKEKAESIKAEITVDRPRTPDGFKRPYLRVNVKKEIYDNAPKDKEGRYLDPNTGLPIEGKPDIGHKPGHEHWREAKKACDEELTKQEFNDRMNNADLYQLEDLHNNRSGIYEDKSAYRKVII